MSQYSPLATPTEYSRLYVKDSNGDYLFVPGTASYTESGGESPTREQVTYEGKSQIVGLPSPPSIEVDMPAPAIGTTVYNLLLASKESRQFLEFRLDVPAQEIYKEATGTFAIASTDGAVTFSASDKPDLTESRFGPGVAIAKGTGANRKLYVIDTISATGAAVVANVPGTSVTAVTDYEIVIPGKRRSFSAVVSTFDNLTAESEGQLGTSLTLTPSSALPKVELI